MVQASVLECASVLRCAQRCPPWLHAGRVVALFPAGGRDGRGVSNRVGVQVRAFHVTQFDFWKTCEMLDFLDNVGKITSRNNLKRSFCSWFEPRISFPK